MATGGSGILGDGDLHPDMVNLLANKAADTASKVLRICIRGIDYCPPVDVTFGDYLRAIITADIDMVAEDERNYRVAFIEAFQERRIFPAGVKTMSVEALAYKQYPDLKLFDMNEKIFVEFLRSFKNEVGYERDRQKIHDRSKEFIEGGKTAKMGIHKRISVKFLQSDSGQLFTDLPGLRFHQSKSKCRTEGFDYSLKSNTATYQIENLWLASRITPDDKLVNHVILTMVQKRGVRVQVNKDGDFSIKGYYQPSTRNIPEDGFIFRGGCTLIFDLDTLKLKYAIKKDICDVVRLEEQYKYMNDLNIPDSSVYFNDKTLAALSGPFAFMHSHSKHP